MATWRAECWLGSEVGYQNLEVEANTIQGAKSQLERIYGAEQIIDLHEVYDDNRLDRESTIDLGGLLGVFAIILIIISWKFILAFGIIGLAIWYFVFYNK
jgi:hypothetical protein